MFPRRSLEILSLVLSVTVIIVCSQTCPAVPTTPPGNFSQLVLNITADQTLAYVYIDGLSHDDLPNYNNYAKVDTIVLPQYARLLAVHGQHSLAHAGFIASVSNGWAVTSQQWKCEAFEMDSVPGNWFDLGYNDSSWLAAVEIGIHGDPNVDFDWGCIDGISPSAYWIWTRTSVTPATDRHIYCRGYLPVCQVIRPCQNGGTCLPNGPEICECLEGFLGTYCELDLYPCRSAPCQNGGTCFSAPNYYNCTCPPNYSGKNCETYINVCDSNPCLNGGTCVDQGGSFTCTCVPYSTGTLCETYENACASAPCLNNGTCINYGASYTCSCSSFYEGLRCENLIPYDCGDILHNAANTTVLPEGWHLGCYIGEGDEAYWYTPCHALLQGLSVYGSSDALLAAGGDYGCWASSVANSDVINACYPNYQHDLVLGDCSVCTFMAVCVQFPETAARRNLRPLPESLRRRLRGN